MRASSARRSVERNPLAKAEARLGDLFDRNVDDVYRYCLARSGDAETAADATSEAFLDAARVAAAGRESEIDRAWLFTVARRRLIDHWRASSRQARRVERLVGERSRQRRGDLADELALVSAAEVVQTLRSLPERQRAALALRYLDEWSVSEIADALEIAYPAAESLLARGRRSFERAWRANHRSGPDRRGTAT